TEIISVDKTKNQIQRVHFKDGKSLDVDLIVSNMEVIPFYKKITKESDKKLKLYKKKYGPACSGFALHLGVNKTYDILRHHNFSILKI
ncbi:MAG: hypothetical protein WCZ00_05355, partial [Acholeplasmataceae bacterium]